MAVVGSVDIGPRPKLAFVIGKIEPLLGSMSSGEVERLVGDLA